MWAVTDEFSVGAVYRLLRNLLSPSSSPGMELEVGEGAAGRRRGLGEGGQGPLSFPFPFIDPVPPALPATAHRQGMETLAL